MFTVKMLNKFDTRSLAWLMSAASTDEARPILTHMAIQNGDLVTSDGFRIHSVPIPTSLRDTELPDVFKPLDTIRLSSNVVNFEANGDYPFPDTDQIIPKKDPVKVFSVNLKFLRDAISQCPTPKDTTIPLRFTIRKDHGPIELSWGMSEVLPNGETDPDVKRRHTAYIMPVHDDQSMDAEFSNPEMAKAADRLKETIADVRKDNSTLSDLVTELREKVNGLEGELSKAWQNSGHVDTKEWVSRDAFEEVNLEAKNRLEQVVELKREVRKLQATIQASIQAAIDNAETQEPELPELVVAFREFLGRHAVDNIHKAWANRDNGLAIENERLEAENAQLTEQFAAIKAALS